MTWEPPAWGAHFIAVPSRDYEQTRFEVETFFGRPVARYNSWFNHDGLSYVVFSFPKQDDAVACSQTFKGETFDPRDRGRGKHWMRWYKGRDAKRDRNRSAYDFGRRH